MNRRSSARCRRGAGPRIRDRPPFLPSGLSAQSPEFWRWSRTRGPAPAGSLRRAAPSPLQTACRARRAAPRTRPEPRSSRAQRASAGRAAPPATLRSRPRHPHKMRRAA